MDTSSLDSFDSGSFLDDYQTLVDGAGDVLTALTTLYNGLPFLIQFFIVASLILFFSVGLLHLMTK